MKKVLIGVVSLLVLVVGGLVFVWSNLDGIVKDAIQTFGTEATKTTVSVADVKLKLEAGEAEIRGLKVANPTGFSDPNIFELGTIRAKIDVATVNQNPIVIDEITISDLAVIYEINKSGTSNADVLKKNLGVGGSGASNSAVGDSAGEELKMVIRKLVVEGTSAKVRIAALGKKEQSVKLPRIYLTDVGKKSGGVTAAEIAQILSSKLLANVKSSVMKLGVNQYLGKSADLFKGRLNSAEKLGGGLGGAGDMGGNAAGAMKGLLGN